MNATGIGFMVKPNLHVAHWSRWLFLAAIGFIYNGCLAYILTDTDVNFNRKKAPYMRAQSFFIVFYYVAAQVMIFFGTITSTVNAHIICMIASLVAFFVSILLYFFPHNKLSLVRPDDYMLFSQTSRANEKMKYDVIMTYRGMFLGFIVLCYVFNFIIWFLGRSNDISEVISFKGEMIAYLVSDFVFIVIFSLVFIALTFYFGKMKTVGIKASDGTVSFKSIPLNAFNSRSKPRSV